jgi:uncharacterized membrane protein (DUF441 family)
MSSAIDLCALTAVLLPLGRGGVSAAHAAHAAEAAVVAVAAGVVTAAAAARGGAAVSRPASRDT